MNIRNIDLGLNAYQSKGSNGFDDFKYLESNFGCDVLVLKYHHLKVFFFFFFVILSVVHLMKCLFVVCENIKNFLSCFRCCWCSYILLILPSSASSFNLRTKKTKIKNISIFWKKNFLEGEIQCSLLRWMNLLI